MSSTSIRHALTAALVAATVALAASGCTAGRNASASATARATAGPSTATGPGPSESAKMICQPEAADEIAAAIGVQPNQPPASSWANQVYSCRYTYPTGVMVLSIKELSDGAATAAYYTAAQNALPSHTTVQVLGQDGFVGPDGSTYVRKDFKVLRVDVSALPATFGQPPEPRADAAFTVAAVIMSCWTGN
jgi:hypothetical protein